MVKIIYSSDISDGWVNPGALMERAVFNYLPQLDFNDVRTIASISEKGFVAEGYGDGIQEALEDAVGSPLLQEFDFFKAKGVLFSISFSYNNYSDSLMADSKAELDAIIEKFKGEFEIKWGAIIGPAHKKKIGLRVLATGY